MRIFASDLIIIVRKLDVHLEIVVLIAFLFYIEHPLLKMSAPQCETIKVINLLAIEITHGMCTIYQLYLFIPVLQQKVRGSLSLDPFFDPVVYKFVFIHTKCLFDVE